MLAKVDIAALPSPGPESPTSPEGRGGTAHHLHRLCGGGRPIRAGRGHDVQNTNLAITSQPCAPPPPALRGRSAFRGREGACTIGSVSQVGLSRLGRNFAPKLPFAIKHPRLHPARTLKLELQAQIVRDRDCNRFNIPLQVFVGKSKYLPTQVFQKSLPRKIRFADIFVVLAIKFDDQRMLHTSKISVELADGVLASKLEATGAPRSQNAPECVFGFGLVLAKPSCSFDFWVHGSGPGEADVCTDELRVAKAPRWLQPSPGPESPTSPEGRGGMAHYLHRLCGGGRSIGAGRGHEPPGTQPAPKAKLKC